MFALEKEDNTKFDNNLEPLHHPREYLDIEAAIAIEMQRHNNPAYLEVRILTALGLVLCPLSFIYFTFGFIYFT